MKAASHFYIKKHSKAKVPFCLICIRYKGDFFMNPCELNAAIAAITNYLYANLCKDDFICLSVFLNELSKSMFTTTLFGDLCNKEGRFKPKN